MCGAAGEWVDGRGGVLGGSPGVGVGGGLELLIRFELSPNIREDLLSVN